MNRILIIGIMLMILTFAVQAQEDDKMSMTQRAVETKNFIFKAETVTPQRGRMMQVTPEYDLTIRPDSVIAFLPYFGRAFTSTVGPVDGGIKFTSTDFNYSSVKKKKNRWEITIIPKDGSDVRSLYLTVFDNGRASLQVINNNRDGISYNGYIQEGKPFGNKGF